MKKQKQQKKFLKNITIYLNYKFKKIIKKSRITDKKAIKNGKHKLYRRITRKQDKRYDVTEETLATMRNNKNVIAKEEGKKISKPTKKRY